MLRYPEISLDNYLFIYYGRKNRSRRDAVAQRLINATVVVSIPTQGNGLFPFPGSSNRTKHVVQFRYSKRNILKIRLCVENGVS